MNEIIKTQASLIKLLEGQVADLTIMSKIELGDDVIAEIKKLKTRLSIQFHDQSKEIEILKNSL
jgi:hypothetical protein